MRTSSGITRISLFILDNDFSYIYQLAGKLSKPFRLVIKKEGMVKVKFQNA
jgi:hypothetical protein